MASERKPFSPEQHHNIIPPERGRRFGISSPPVIAPERPVTVPTQPRPDTKQPGPEGRPTKPKKHTGRNIVLAGVGLVGGGLAAYETVPAVHERVDSFLNSFTDKRLVSSTEAETKKDNPKEVFDPYAERGVIKDSDILRGVSLETIQEAPMFDENGNPLFFMATPKQGEVSHFEKSLVAPGILPEALEQAKAKNVKDKWRQDVKSNGSVPMPLDGYVFLMVVDRGGKPAFAGVKVLFMTPNNTLDFVNITTDDNRRVPLINAPTVSKENGFGKDYQKGLLLRRGELLFYPIKDTTIDYMRQSGEGGTLATNRRIPGDIIPLTIKDPLTGKEKLPAQ